MSKTVRKMDLSIQLSNDLNRAGYSTSLPGKKGTKKNFFWLQKGDRIFQVLVRMPYNKPADIDFREPNSVVETEPEEVLPENAASSADVEEQLNQMESLQSDSDVDAFLQQLQQTDAPVGI